MSLNTCFDWFKKLRLLSYVLNLKIDVETVPVMSTGPEVQDQ
jgi:hypothetical protein